MAFRVSLQLYTVRDAVSNRFLDGLTEVADIGYEWVEFAGFGDSSAVQAGKRMAELGLRASGAHVPLSVLDDPSSTMEELHTIKCKEATLPWIPPEMRSNWKDVAGRLDDCAHRFAEHGIAFGYHNHDFEFAESGYRELTRSAKIAKFQLDVFWAEKAGESAVSWISALRGRLPSIHCKDMGADGQDIEIGEGVLDWPSILAAAETAGVRTLVTEMDTPRHEPLKSARMCLEGLNRQIQAYGQSQT